jgi:hypothetical protein
VAGLGFVSAKEIKQGEELAFLVFVKNPLHGTVVRLVPRAIEDILSNLDRKEKGIHIKINNRQTPFNHGKAENSQKDVISKLLVDICH